MNYTEEFILNTLFINIFLRKMCLLFNISHDSQPIKCTNPNWTFQTGGNVLGTIFSGGVIHIWCSSVECGYVSVVHLFSFSPESFSDLIFPPLLPDIVLFRFHASPVVSHLSNSAESRLRSPAASLTTCRRSRLASKRCSTQTCW